MVNVFEKQDRSPEAGRLALLAEREDLGKLALYVKEDGILYTADGVPVSRSDALYRFPEDFNYLSEDSSERLREMGVVRLLTDRFIVQLSPDGRYRVYPIEKTVTITTIRTLKKIGKIRRGMSQAVRRVLDERKTDRKNNKNTE